MVCKGFLTGLLFFANSGIKINTRFDYNLECADYLFITNAKKHENSTLKDMCHKE